MLCLSAWWTRAVGSREVRCGRPGFAGFSCPILVRQRQALGGSDDTTTVLICNTLETRTVDSGLLLSKNASPWRGLASTRVG